MKKWNTYFEAYALSQGRTCEEQLAFDKERWPGGKMAGFILWINEAWDRWSSLTGETPAWGGHWSTDQRSMFSGWLDDTYFSEN